MTQTEQASRERDWHLDRKVTLSLIAAIIAQTVGATWWAATLSARVDTVERTQIEHRRDIDDSVRAERAMIERVTRMEERLATALEILRRLDAARERRTDLRPVPVPME